MLRDSKQRLAPVAVRRWALRCGEGLLLGAGICAAAAGTAHADAPNLTGKALDLVARTAAADTSAGTHASPGTTSAGSSSKVADTSPIVTKPAEAVHKSPATKLVPVSPSKPAHVGRHRAAPGVEPILDGVARPAGTVLAGAGDTGQKVSGRLGDVVGGTASSGHHAPAGHPSHSPVETPAAGTADPVANPLPMPRVPAGPTVPMPAIQLPGHPLPLPRVTLPGSLPDPSRDGLAGLLPALLAGPSGRLPDLSGALPALGIPSLELPGLALPGLALPRLALPALPAVGLPAVGLPAVGLPTPGDPVAAFPGVTHGSIDLNVTAQQGPAGTASGHLSRVALPVAPSAPAAPRGPRPTGPVPAIPAGTGAGAASVLTTAWAEPAGMAGRTPSGRGIRTAGFAGLAPRDRAGMPSITPD